MLKTLLIGIAILACASMAAAQSDDYKKFEFFAGYSYRQISRTVADEGIVDEPEGYLGFNTSITRNVSRYVGVKFDYSGHFNSRTLPFGPSGTGIDFDSRFYNFLGGVQVKDNSSETTLKPFVHALVGAAHIHNRVHIRNDVCIAIFPTPCRLDFSEKDTGFAAAFGGGLDIRATNHIDVRIIQIDYDSSRLFDSTQRSFRIGIGIVLH